MSQSEFLRVSVQSYIFGVTTMEPTMEFTKAWILFVFKKQVFTYV